MAKTIKCRRCSKVFTLMGALGQLCPNCIRDEEETYLKVRSFVKDNPGVSVQEVSEILGISRTKILGYIKEERLEVTSSSKASLHCKNCGKTITTGVFCMDCKRVHSDVKKMDDDKAVKLKYADEKSWTYEKR